MVAGVDDGVGDVLAGLFADIGHAGFAGVAGGEDVVHRLVAGRVDVESVDAALVEHVEYLHALLDGAPAGEAVVKADAVGDGEVGADDGADGVHGLHREAAAVLKAPAVLVLAVVPDLAHELVHQVAGVGVDLDAVEAHENGVLRGDLPVLHHLVDLVHGEGAADHAGVVEARVLGRGDGHALADLGHAVAAGAAGELGEYLRAPAVHALGELGAARDALVAGEVQRAAALGALLVDEVSAGVDEADAAFGALLVIAQAALGLHLVDGGRGEGAHAGHAYAVADTALVDVDGAPEYAVVVFLIAAGHLVRFLPLIIGLGWLSPP